MVHKTARLFRSSHGGLIDQVDLWLGNSRILLLSTALLSRICFEWFGALALLCKIASMVTELHLVFQELRQIDWTGPQNCCRLGSQAFLWTTNWILKSSQILRVLLTLCFSLQWHLSTELRASFGIYTPFLSLQNTLWSYQKFVRVLDPIGLNLFATRRLGPILPLRNLISEDHN